MLAGDKFRLGTAMDGGILLLGRKTWQLFLQIWPGRNDPFAARTNAMLELVATRTLTGTSAWGSVIGFAVRRFRIQAFPLAGTADTEPRWLLRNAGGLGRAP